MTTPTDWRALCADIVRASDAVQYDAAAAEGDFLAAVDNARQALDQPEPEGLTDEKLLMTYQHAVSAKVESIIRSTGTYAGMDDLAAATLAGLHAVLSRWSRPAIERARPQPEGPIPESELADMWNQQADSFNQWESLDSGEQLEWAQARAITRCTRPAIEPVPQP